METLSITFHKQPWICVLDPVFMLCSSGLESLQVTGRLGNLIELWVFRELFHILDDTPLYVDPAYPNTDYSVTSQCFHRPATPLGHSVRAAGEEISNGKPITIPKTSRCHIELPFIETRSLNAWEQIRRNTDLGGYQFYWLGDSLSQSRLPERLQRGENPDHRRQRYELLAQALEAQALLSQASPGTNDFQQPLQAACRDAIALSAALGSAFILAAQSGNADSPYLIECLQSWDIPCQQMSAADPLVKIEKKMLAQLFVEAGLTPLFWSKKLQLAVIHLRVPAALDPALVPNDEDSSQGDDAQEFDRPWELENMPYAPVDSNLWEDAEGYWYPLNAHSVTSLAYAKDTPSLTC